MNKSLSNLLVISILSGVSNTAFANLTKLNLEVPKYHLVNSTLDIMDLKKGEYIKGNLEYITRVGSGIMSDDYMQLYNDDIIPISFCGVKAHKTLGVLSFEGDVSAYFEGKIIESSSEGVFIDLDEIKLNSGLDYKCRNKKRNNDFKIEFNK